MPVLLLENMPDELYRQLEQLAQRHQQSAAAVALSLLEDAVARREVDPASVPAMLDEIRRTRYPLAPGTPDSVELLHEDRAR